MTEDKKKSDQEPEDDSKLTPEEKLFRFISSGYTPMEENQESPVAEEEDWIKNLKNPLKGPFEKLKQACKKMWHQILIKWPVLEELTSLRFKSGQDKAPFAYELKNINKILAILVAILACYLLIDLLFGNPKSHFMKKEQAFLNAPNASLVPAYDPNQIKPLAYYLVPTNDRDVFLPHKVQQSLKAGEEGLAPGDVANTFKLVGISWDIDGFVAMIESTTDGKAVFVRKGEKLSGNIEIEDIQEYVVTLRRGEEKWELR